MLKKFARNIFLQWEKTLKNLKKGRKLSPKELSILSHLSLKYLKSLYYIENASLHTLRAYKQDLNQFLSRLNAPEIVIIFQSEEPIFSTKGPVNIKSDAFKGHLNTEDVLLLDQIQATLISWSEHSPATRNRKAACLKSFFKFLFIEKQTKSDLSDKIQCPKVPKKLPHYLSVDEVLAVLNKLKLAHKNQTKNIVRDRALISLLYGGGLRVSEACQLKWKDIGMSKQVITLLGKGNKQRLITPPGYTLECLSELNQFSIYIFGEKPLSTRLAYDIVKSWGRKSELTKPLTPHMLRHSFATHLLSSGANLRSLQELLGHATLTATEKYTHVTTDELQRTLNSHHPLEVNKKDFT